MKVVETEIERRQSEIELGLEALRLARSQAEDVKASIEANAGLTVRIDACRAYLDEELSKLDATIGEQVDRRLETLLESGGLLEKLRVALAHRPNLASDRDEEPRDQTVDELETAVPMIKDVEDRISALTKAARAMALSKDTVASTLAFAATGHLPLLTGSLSDRVAECIAWCLAGGRLQRLDCDPTLISLDDVLDRKVLRDLLRRVGTSEGAVHVLHLSGVDQAPSRYWLSGLLHRLATSTDVDRILVTASLRGGEGRNAMTPIDLRRCVPVVASASSRPPLPLECATRDDVGRYHEVLSKADIAHERDIWEDASLQEGSTATKEPSIEQLQVLARLRSACEHLLSESSLYSDLSTVLWRWWELCGDVEAVDLRMVHAEASSDGG